MKKFLSLILALTLVASLFTVNVMAASKAHNVTLSADKTTELKAGDTVKVEVVIDNTANIISCGYDLAYDMDAFEIDNENVTNRIENYIDGEWKKAIDTDDDWAYYMGKATYGPTNKTSETGVIAFKWAASGAVEEEYAVDNKVIGKFYIKVKDGAADGEYTFSLTGNTMDGGENSKTAMVCAPVTVKVGAAAPSNPTVGDTTAAATNGVASTDSSKIYDNALAVSTVITPVATTTEIGVLFAPKAWLGSNDLAATLAGVAKASKTGVLGTAETTLKAAIKDIPRALQDTDLVMVTRAFAYDGTDYTYAAPKETTVNFTKTAE